MTSPLFFILWRGALIAMLGYAVRELYGWHPAPLLVLVMLAIAGDSIATLFAVLRASGGRSILNRIFQTLRRR